MITTTDLKKVHRRDHRGGVAIGLAALFMVLLSATAQAHYPYEIATPPAWWTQTLGPSVTGMDGVTYSVECTLTERIDTPYDYETVYNLDWLGPPEETPSGSPDDRCKREWGPAYVRCSGHAQHRHFTGLAVDPGFDWGCIVVRAAGDARSACYRDFAYYDLGGGEPPDDTGWVPYDCRAEVLVGWPNSPSAPAGDSRLVGADRATCTKRRCRFEVNCENATGDHGCEFILDLGDRLGNNYAGGRKPESLDDGQAKTLAYKTTKRARKKIVRRLRAGQRSVKGDWFASNLDTAAKAVDSEGKIKIRLKR